MLTNLYFASLLSECMILGTVAKTSNYSHHRIGYLHSKFLMVLRRVLVPLANTTYSFF